MLFPFRPARAATFHMGSVAFAIDLVFAEASGCVGRIVHGAQPGSRSRWSHPVVGAVIELPGGFAARAGLDIGDQVAILGPPQAVRVSVSADAYNPLRGLVEADAPLLEGYYSKEPLETKTPRDPRGLERWKERRLPDEAFPEAMDNGAPSGWREQFGYQPCDRPGVVGPNVRMTAGAPLVWTPDVLNAGVTETSVVPASEVGGWLTARGFEHPHQLADAVVLEGLADQASVAPDGQTLVLHRGRR